MGDELFPGVEISFASPSDPVTTLISSITSIHNVNNITRTKYAEIRAALEVYDRKLKTHEKEFADKMLYQQKNLDIYYGFLEKLFDGARTGSGDNAKYCRDLALRLMQVIEQIDKNGPNIL